MECDKADKKQTPGQQFLLVLFRVIQGMPRLLSGVTNTKKFKDFV